MTSEERIKCVLRHEEPDRVPIQGSPWTATVNRWKKEGLPDDIPVEEYFGYEIVQLGFDCTPLRTYQTARSEGKFINCSSGGGWGYDMLQAYMRPEQLLMAMADDPDWIREMILTLADLHLKMMEMMVGKGFKFDGVFVSNDMGYRNGLLFSPQTYRKTHREADEMVFSFCHKHNMAVILHSCGDIKELIPDLIEVGIDCLNPLEVKAGMDIRELKREYADKLSFMGGIDVRAMANPDPNVIEEEIRSKFEVAKKGGGYIYHEDHSIPNNVSFEQYKRVMELVKKYGKY